mgnify:CR=1 FL=1
MRKQNTIVHLTIMNNKMKKIRVNFVVFVLTLATLACGKDENQESIEDLIASEDVEQLQAKESELAEEIAGLENKRTEVNQAIEALDSNKKLPLVSVIEVKTQVFDHFVELQGDVHTDQNILIFPEVQGELLAAKVKSGDLVQKGQLIAIIDDSGLRKQVEQLQQQTELSKITYERQKNLWDQKIGSEMDFLRAETNYRSNQKALESLREQLAKTQVKAPFSGILDDFIADEGQLLIPAQTPLARLVNLDKMYIKAAVPESHLPSFKYGNKVKLKFPVLDTMIEGQISQLGNYINPANRTFDIRVKFPNQKKKIKPNMAVKLSINDYSNPNALVIEQSLISENAEGEQYLYLAKKENGKTLAQKSIITTGEKQAGNVEVLSGLYPGATVISEGARMVRDGQEIKVIGVQEN